MTALPSYTIDRATAATLRDWLFEHAVQNHGKPEISDPLAKLATAIDSMHSEPAAAVALGAWAQTGPPDHQDATHVDGSPVDEHGPNDARDSAEPVPLDVGGSEPDRIYDTLPDAAWQLKHDQSGTNRNESPTAPSHGKTSAASSPRRRWPHHRPSVRYHAAFECSVCGGVRALETSLRVCAFVDKCTSCGVVARFTAGEIPTPATTD